MNGAFLREEEKKNKSSVIVRPEAKHFLLQKGYVKLGVGVILEGRAIRPSSGPGVGGIWYFFRFPNGERVKLRVERGGEPGKGGSEGEKEEVPVLRRDGVGRLGVFVGETPLVVPVEVEEPLLHAPSLAFIDICSACRFSCAFCNIRNTAKEKITRKEKPLFLDRAVDAVRAGKCAGIAVTAGVTGTQEEHIDRLAGVLSYLRERLGDGPPLGVEPLIFEEKEVYSSLEKLRRCGATEIKINVQTTDEIFRRVCPGLSPHLPWRSLEMAVELYPPGSVSSNVIVGLGEEVEEVEGLVENLVLMGVVPTLRVLHVDRGNRSALLESLGRIPFISVEDLRRIANFTSKLVKKYQVYSTMKTMCHQCGACDVWSP